MVLLYMSDKKYTIITNIEDDAPYGNINWCTISFLTPEKIDSINFLDIKGFKVHNGFNTFELAKNDAKERKEKNKNHDVYLSQLGKIYGWDDATRTEEIEYGDDKLDELEKTRRENIDKIKLIKEQFKNEYKTLYANTNMDRMEQQRNKMKKKLYEKGLITKEEYEMIQEVNKPTNEIKDTALKMEKMNSEIDECFKTDYLDENEPTALKYGCATIFTPKHIGGLKTVIFKIRGLFQTQQELEKRINRLKKLYPNNRIHRFEVGKWCAYSDNDFADPEILLKQLNYAMKCYLDNMENEKENFEKRKQTLQDETENEAKLQKESNQRQKRKRTGKKISKKPGKEPTAPVSVEDKQYENIPLVGIPEDQDAIQKVINYLDDPELRNKFAVNKSDRETVAVDIN